MFRPRIDKTPIALEAARELLAGIEGGDTNVCQWCKGIHARACPRVKSMSWHGQEVTEVQFWDTWDDSSVLWPEELAALIIEADGKGSDD